jgi:hypothetical protein
LNTNQHYGSLQINYKLYIGSRLVLNYFSEVNQVCKTLIKLTPKDYATNFKFPPEIIMEDIGATEVIHFQTNTVNHISDAKKQALKTHWVRKLQMQQLTSPWYKFSSKGLKQKSNIK